MGTDENPINRLYNKPIESPSECPCFSAAPDHIEVCPRFYPTLYCNECGFPVSPFELTLDVGDGDVLLCDKCLGISN